MYIPNKKKLPKPISPTFNFSVLDVYVVWVQPGKLTWNLNITCLKREIIFQTFIFGFHVNFQGCIFFETNLRFRAFFLGVAKFRRRVFATWFRVGRVIFVRVYYFLSCHKKSWCDLCCHDTLACCDDKWLIIAISLPSVSILTVTGMGLASPLRTCDFNKFTHLDTISLWHQCFMALKRKDQTAMTTCLFQGYQELSYDIAGAVP